MLQYLKKIEKDRWVVLLLILICTYSMFNLKHWNKEGRVISWDVIDYYGYLPATFIYGDVTLASPNEKFEHFHPKIWYHKTAEGKKVFKTSMGMSILYSPFFALSHVYASYTNHEASGYSIPYKFGICMSSLFYLILGLFFLRIVLREYYSANVTSLTLFLIVMATNLYYYVVIGVGMSHNYLFCLLSIILYCLIKWYRHPTLKMSIVIGLLSGLMILVRPTMILILFFALFFNVASLQDVKDRIAFYQNHFGKVLLIFIGSTIAWLVQIIYWKVASGSFIYYSYTDEGFFFLDPQIINSLFSFRKGWLLYTPIMIFALVGLGIMFKKQKKLAFPIIIVVVAYLYVTSCWWTWWFGGSFGNRTMIELFPLLAIGLAYVIKLILDLSKGFKISFLTLIFILLGFNLFQTRQAHEGLLHHDSMSKEAYFKILFKLQKQISIKEVEPFLNPPDYHKALKGDRNQ